jgi:hypothetical protein
MLSMLIRMMVKLSSQSTANPMGTISKENRTTSKDRATQYQGTTIQYSAITTTSPAIK